MKMNEYEYIQRRFSEKLKNRSYATNKEAAYNNGVLACKSILKEIFERGEQNEQAGKGE